MIANSEVAKSPPPKIDLPGLPSFRERLPELFSVLESTASHLEDLPSGASYIVSWEKLYECAHTLKGLSKLLACSPPELGEDVAALCDIVGLAFMGEFTVRKHREVAKTLREIERALSAGARLTLLLQELRETLTRESTHEERIARVPKPIHQWNEFISKKAFEAVQLKLPMWILEEEMVLGNYTAWSKKLISVIRPADAPHGLIIHSAPQISGGNGTQVTAIAWVAAPTARAEGYEENLRKAFPKAKFRDCV